MSQGFIPEDHLEKSLYEALMILVNRFKRTMECKLLTELRELNEALVNYHNTKECGGGTDHDWDFCAECEGCGAPDSDCANTDTIWCPTCLGCR